MIICEFFTFLTKTMFIYIKRLAKKRQFDILVQGYEIKNDDLIFINTKIMIFTQEFIYNSKRFLEPNI